MTPDLTALFARLDELPNYANWDGEGAQPVWPGTVEEAKALLRDIATAAGAAWIEPGVSPTPDGEVSINWHEDDCGGRSACIDLAAGGMLAVVTQPPDGAPSYYEPTREGAITLALWAMEGAAQAAKGGI